MYSSGTTALPKGVVLTYGGFSDFVFNSGEPATDESAGSTLIAAPLYHVAGITSIMTSLYGGKTLVLIRQFDAAEWLIIVQRERITNAFLVPTMITNLLDHPDFTHFDISSLQVVSYGAAPMPVPTILRAIEAFPKHVQFMNSFGQTETTGTVTLLTPDDHRMEGTDEEIEAKKRRLASIGRPVGEVELAILGEDGQPVEANVTGEIAIRAVRQMAGYWKRPDDTAKTIVDGWIRTRDLGWMDEGGYIYLAGRTSDMIIRGGENIAPEQIEAILHAHPYVQECAVVGVPDEKWGEVVKAFVVRRDPSLSAGEIAQFCKERMSSFKVPEIIEFVPSLPRNAMGKVLKKDLRAMS
jgi:acyl-CoA synthetase (AMP-forming)/AMP-acid ligase II